MSQYWTVLGCVIILWGVFLLDGGVSDYGLICHVPLLYVSKSVGGGVGGRKMAEIRGKLGFESLGGSRIIPGKAQKSWVFFY